MLQAPEAAVKAYCDRLKVCREIDRSINRILIFISEAGHIKVCVDFKL